MADCRRLLILLAGFALTVCIALQYFPALQSKINRDSKNTVRSMSIYRSKIHHTKYKNINHGKSSLSSAEVASKAIPITFYTYKNRQHWVPDWYESQLSVEAMLADRRENIKARCRELHYSTKNLKHRFAKYIDTKTLHYCATYKAAHTFWNAFFRHQQKVENSQHTQQTVERKKRVGFIVTRNPWHRLVSCWYDRFTLPNRLEFMKVFCGKTWRTLPPFSVFVNDCVVRRWKKNRYLNPHWMPVVMRCAVCDKLTDYDYFFTQENMNSEVIDVLPKHAGIPDTKNYITSLQRRVLRPGERMNVSKSYQDQYRSVSKENLITLSEIYRDEIYIFGYPQTPFVDFPNA